MSRHYLELDGAALARLEVASAAGVWRCFELPLGDEIYHIEITKTTPETHTTPPVGPELPSLDDVAEVVGVLALRAACTVRGGGV